MFAAIGKYWATLKGVIGQVTPSRELIRFAVVARIYAGGPDLEAWLVRLFSKGHVIDERVQENWKCEATKEDRPNFLKGSAKEDA